MSIEKLKIISKGFGSKKYKVVCELFFTKKTFLGLTDESTNYSIEIFLPLDHDLLDTIVPDPENETEETPGTNHYEIRVNKLGTFIEEIIKQYKDSPKSFTKTQTSKRYPDGRITTTTDRANVYIFTKQ